MDNHLKCRFCGWCTKKWTTRKKNKKTVYGYNKIVSHVMMEHWEEYQKIIKWIVEDNETSQENLS